METYKASNLPTRTRVAAWNEIYSSQLDKVDLTPANRDHFDAEIRLNDLGPLRVIRVTSSGYSIDRTTHHLDQGATRAYTLVLQTKGSGTLVQYGREAFLYEGDLTLYDNAAPHSHVMGELSEIVMLRVPAEVLREHLPTPEHFCGRRLAAADGLTLATATLMKNLCQQLECGLPISVQERLARQTLELAATTYAVAFDALLCASSVTSSRLAKARLLVEKSLRDPELGPGMIAGALKVSSRYLRMIFAATDESVSCYILRRRLEECARQLADPRWRGRSICEIAFSFGFNSAPHFSRSFRDRYSMSPRQYRLQHVNAG